jgi:hypothetical protein
MDRYGQQAGDCGSGGISGTRVPEIESYQSGKRGGKLCHISVRQGKRALGSFPTDRFHFQNNEVWKEEKGGDKRGVDEDIIEENKVFKGDW